MQYFMLLDIGVSSVGYMGSFEPIFFAHIMYFYPKSINWKCTNNKFESIKLVGKW